MNPNDGRERRTWRGSWTDIEKGLAMEVLNRMPPEDQPAMDGVAMNKVDEMPPASVEQPSVLPPGLPEGLPVAPEQTWHTIAHFRYRIATTAITVTETKEFMVSRAALENPKKALGEAQEEARRTIAHEIGHVVEKQSYMAASRAMHDALRDSHRAWNAYEKARTEATDARLSMANIQRQYDDLCERVRTAKVAQDEAYAAYVAAHQSAEAAYNAVAEVQGTTPSAALTANLTNAKAALAAKQEAWQSAADSCKNATKRRDDYARTTYAPPNAKVTELVAVQNQRAEEITASRERFLAAKRRVAAVYSEASQRTNRLKNFVTMVNTAGVAADITPYAKKEWPDKPQEFFAESYALFILDPDALKRHSTALSNYFVRGEYRNDA